jgi:4-amino-4-deoxy-L-arabinose transferase-like glycosyltransferase
MTFKERIKNTDLAYVTIPLTILAVMWVIAAFTGLWPWKGNAYNSYTLQACSWLQGRLDLGQNYEWLELAIYNGKYYVSFPPFPSYVMLPFALIFGTNTPDHFIALAVTVIGAVYAVKLYRELAKTSRYVEFFVLFLYLSSGLLFVSINGYVWFIAQNMCFTLSLMALFYALRGRGGRSLAFWACAVGCRPMVVLYFPVLAYVLWKQWKQKNNKGTIIGMIKEKWYWGIAPVVIALSYMVLNYLRFGNISQFCHDYLPEHMNSEKGQFDLSYLADNLKNLFRLPQAGEQSGSALQFYTGNGMAFWLVIPLFITVFIAWVYCFVKKRKGYLVSLVMIPLLVVLHIIFICCHNTLGGWHFGNRYLLDALPYLFFGLMLWKPKEDWFARINMPLFFLGFALNLVGTVATYNYWISFA